MGFLINPTEIIKIAWKSPFPIAVKLQRLQEKICMEIFNEKSVLVFRMKRNKFHCLQISNSK